MKKSIETFLQKFPQNTDGISGRGFASIKGGFTAFFLSTNNSGIGQGCTNSGSCSSINSQICSNTGDCQKTTNSSGAGWCTNKLACRY